MLLNAVRLFRGWSMMYRADLGSHRTLAWAFEQVAADPQRAQHPFLLYGDRRYSYREANAEVNRRVAAYRRMGIGKNDVVALMMDNRPEFLWHYLAAGKLGAILALINRHLVGEGLVHALSLCEPRRIIVGSEWASVVAEIRSRLPPAFAEGVEVDVDPEQPGVPSGEPKFERLLDGGSAENPPETACHRLSDVGAYIFTSGTTGLPKAARVSYHKLTSLGRAMGVLAWRIDPSAVVYNCLPLFHSNALMVAIASVIAHGATLALARRFSVSQFWSDIHKYRATSFNYIGEIGRYLLNAEPSPLDRGHRVDAMIGQGLRSELWERFRERFGVQRIIEFYASTEGNIGTINLTGKVGSVGKLLVGGVMARWDTETNDFVRGPSGRLVRCRAGEVGVLLGRIRVGAPFDGYSDEQASRAKVIRSAFRKDDAWFNTGDLFRIDRWRNLFFLDRVGDTYRWKGENISTIFVEGQIANWQPVAMVAVYGVPVPGTEGRAGMATMMLKPGAGFDPEGFCRHLDERLPAPARPVFVRLSAEIDMTATLKLRKTDLQKAGFDPMRCADPLFFRAAGAGRFEPLTRDLFADVVAGRVRI